MQTCTASHLLIPPPFPPSLPQTRTIPSSSRAAKSQVGTGRCWRWPSGRRVDGGASAKNSRPRLRTRPCRYVPSLPPSLPPSLYSSLDFLTLGFFFFPLIQEKLDDMANFIGYARLPSLPPARPPSLLPFLSRPRDSSPPSLLPSLPPSIPPSFP